MAVLDVDKPKAIFKRLRYDDDKGAALLLRTVLPKTLKSELEKWGWPQKKAAEKLGVKQPRISEIGKFNVEPLVNYLFRLSKEVTFDIPNAQR